MSPTTPARGYWIVLLLDRPRPNGTLGRVVGRWVPARLRHDREGE